MSRTLTRATVVLRDARLEDAPALAEVWDGVIRRADRAEQVADLERVIADAERRDDVRVVVAEHDGTLAGAVYLELAPVTPINLEPTVRAVSPHVLPAYRRHGIGRALMDAAVSWAEELGIGLVAGGKVLVERGGGGGGGRHGDDVDAVEGGEHPVGDAAAEALGLDVGDGGRDGAELEAFADGGAVVLRALAEPGKVVGGGFRGKDAEERRDGLGRGR